MKKIIVLLLSVFLLFTLNAYAQPGAGAVGDQSGGTNSDQTGTAGGMQGRGAPPPPPFVKVCASLSEGAACSFPDRSGSKITGKCVMKSNPGNGKKELVCYNESFFKKMESRRDAGQGQSRPAQK
jgi:hypothetical protein